MTLIAKHLPDSLTPVDPTNPGTPDCEVPSMRLRGREFYRQFPEDRREAAYEARTIEQNSRVEFWKGWLDGRLEPLYEKLRRNHG